MVAITAPARAQVGAGHVQGFVRTVDFAPAAGASVTVRGSTAAQGTTSSTGHFSLGADVTARTGAVVTVTLDGYHRAEVPVPASGDVGTILLIPRTWRIATGAHAGTEVEIDLAGATRPVCAGCDAFYGSVRGDQNSRLPPGIPSWPPRAFPLDVAFDRENGSQITAADSTAFWGIARSLESAFGLRLFRAAELRRVLAEIRDDGPGSLLVTVDPQLPGIGWGSYGGQSGDILAATVHFRSAFTFRSPGAREVVAHEMFHALGFGHTCAWRSLVADPLRCRTQQADSPTPEDVAHAQLLWRIRQLEREARISNTVEAALRGTGLRRRSAAPVESTQRNPASHHAQHRDG